MSDVSDIFSDDNVARANAYVRHLQQHLNIANADHIALWLEGHLDDDTGIGWLACRIVEAHEDATRALSAEVEALREEASALRIGWWNDMRARGVTQDNAITTINTALLNKEPAR